MRQAGTPIGCGLTATGGKLHINMADCLHSRRRQIRWCLNCRCIDSVHFSKDHRRQLWNNYCEHFKPGFTLKEDLPTVQWVCFTFVHFGTPAFPESWGLRSIRPSVDPPRVDPPHVRPKRGRSAPSSGAFRPGCWVVPPRCQSSKVDFPWISLCLGICYTCDKQ